MGRTAMWIGLVALAIVVAGPAQAKKGVDKVDLVNAAGEVIGTLKAYANSAGNVIAEVSIRGAPPESWCGVWFELTYPGGPLMVTMSDDYQADGKGRLDMEYDFDRGFADPDSPDLYDVTAHVYIKMTGQDYAGTARVDPR